MQVSVGAEPSLPRNPHFFVSGRGWRRSAGPTAVRHRASSLPDQFSSAGYVTIVARSTYAVRVGMLERAVEEGR